MAPKIGSEVSALSTRRITVCAADDAGSDATPTRHDAMALRQRTRRRIADVSTPADPPRRFEPNDASTEGAMMALLPQSAHPPLVEHHERGGLGLRGREGDCHRTH